MKHRVSVFFFVLSSCITSIPPEKLLPSQTGHYQLYVWGCYNQFEGNQTTVHECFETLLTDHPSLYAYAGYIQHLFTTQQYQTIVSLIPKLEQALNDNLETQLLFVKALELVGQHKRAEQKIISLHDSFKTHPEVTYGCALAYMRTKKLTQAMEVIDQFLVSTTEKPMHFIFYYLKAQIAAHENKKELAQKSIAKSLKLNPGFQQGWLFSGMLHELANQLDDALTGYRTFLQLVGHDATVEQQIMMLMIKQKQEGPKNLESQLFQEATMLYRQRQFSPALARIDACLQADPRHRAAKLLKLEILCALRQADQILHLLQNYIDEEPSGELWYRAAHLLYQSGDMKQRIIEFFENIEKKHSTLLATLYLADLQLKSGNTLLAQNYIKKALAATSDQLLKSKLYYQLAIVYYQEGSHQALVSTLNDALALETKFAPLLNLAAYYYATKEVDFAKAQTLLDQLFAHEEHAKKNPHYMDTQALVWYKQGNYQRAGQLLVQLATQAPNDFYIQKHLSKALFKQGNKELAIDTMKKALLTTCSAPQKTKCLQCIQAWSRHKKL